MSRPLWRRFLSCMTNHLRKTSPNLKPTQPTRLYSVLALHFPTPLLPKSLYLPSFLRRGQFKPSLSQLARGLATFAGIDSVFSLAGGGSSAAYRIVPHPEKAAKGGEDACYVSTTHSQQSVLAVFDGVGGWADVGVDPSVFSRGLADALSQAVLTAASSPLSQAVQTAASSPLSQAAQTASSSPRFDPLALLRSSHWTVQQQRLPGSSTACVVVLNHSEPQRRQLRYANIGDSGLLVLRPSHPGGAYKACFRSEDVLHGFNFPFQLGSDTASDSVGDAAQGTFELNQGDIVVLGTDGLWDNVFDHDIEDIVSRNHDKTPSVIADELAMCAHANGKRLIGDSPFAVEARRHGYRFAGGKLDDVTVVVARVA